MPLVAARVALRAILTARVVPFRSRGRCGWWRGGARGAAGAFEGVHLTVLAPIADGARPDAAIEFDAGFESLLAAAAIFAGKRVAGSELPVRTGLRVVVGRHAARAARLRHRHIDAEFTVGGRHLRLRVRQQEPRESEHAWPAGALQFGLRRRSTFSSCVDAERFCVVSLAASVLRLEIRRYKLGRKRVRTTRTS